MLDKTQEPRFEHFQIAPEHVGELFELLGAVVGLERLAGGGSCQVLHVFLRFLLRQIEREVLRKGRDMQKYNTGETRRRYYLALKVYKQERKYTIRHYHKLQIDKLYDLETKNPRQFWKILQDLKHAPKLTMQTIL